MEKDYSNKEVNELKKTFRGKMKLFEAGIYKNKTPPMYRITLMKALMTRLTIYMVLFACVFVIMNGFWVFALVLFPVGVIANYYTSKQQLIEYNNIKKQYEIAGLIKPIEEDISNIRRKTRIVEKIMGIWAFDIACLSPLIMLIVLYLTNTSILESLGWLGLSLIASYVIYYKVIYGFCLKRYRRIER
jgi:uncharacterized membrane protein